MKVKKTAGQIAFNTVSYFFTGIVSLMCLLPFLLVISASLTSESAIYAKGYALIPPEFSTQAYRFLFEYPQEILNAYAVTVFITAVGSAAGLFLTAMAGYVLQRPDFKYRNVFSFYIYFTMLFNGGLVPTYLIYTTYFGIKNTFAALLVPSLLMSPWYVLLSKSFFVNNVPGAVLESARIDGARETTVLFRIVVPLSKPVLATVALWCMVSHWNAWYDCMLYIRDDARYVLQYTLQRILLDGQVQDLDNIGAKVNTETMKMASIVVSILPIMVVYPFVQKYFTKGIAMGAVKG